MGDRTLTVSDRRGPCPTCKAEIYLDHPHICTAPSRVQLAYALGYNDGMLGLDSREEEVDDFVLDAPIRL